MNEPSFDTAPSPGTPEDRLNSWKEIATYLSRDVTTVQRWEKREGMPVHRHQHDKIGSVYTFRSELDAWARTRSVRSVPENGDGAASPDTPDAVIMSPVPASRSGFRFRLSLTALVVVLIIWAGFWLYRTEYFWRSPLAAARFQAITDIDGVEGSAAVSRDGHFVAFLAERDGRMDLWLTQVGSGQLHNLTNGSAPELVNPLVRNLGFSPDGSLVTFWVRRRNGPSAEISTWAVPTLGGEPRPYIEHASEYDWSRDGSRLAWHTNASGDPLFVSDGMRQPQGPPIFVANAGVHSHFPLWAPDRNSIYLVQGSLPNRLDIWRVPAIGGAPERITSHNGQVSHPVLLDGRTLLYLARDGAGSGPWLHSIDLERRISHQLTSGLDRYSSLSASADGRRLVVTRTNPNTTLWRMPLTDSRVQPSQAARVPLVTGTGSSPRLGPNYLVYISGAGTHQSLWKAANGTSTELWSGPGAQIIGGPAIAPGGERVAFSVRQRGQTLLYVVQSDGTNAQVIADSLALQGGLAWAPDGQSITSAADDHGVSRLVRVPIDRSPATMLVRDYSVDPVWSPDGRFVAYSGPDIGTTFSVKAVTSVGKTRALPALTLTRGARRLSFLPGGKELVYLRGDLLHKDLWAIDLETGIERQLAQLPSGFDIRDFDTSPDGREVVLERVQDRSDVVLIDLPPS